MRIYLKDLIFGIISIMFYVFFSYGGSLLLNKLYGIDLILGFFICFVSLFVFSFFAFIYTLISFWRL